MMHVINMHYTYCLSCRGWIVEGDSINNIVEVKASLAGHRTAWFGIRPVKPRQCPSPATTTLDGQGRTSDPGRRSAGPNRRGSSQIAGNVAGLGPHLGREPKTMHQTARGQVPA